MDLGPLLVSPDFPELHNARQAQAQARGFSGFLEVGVGVESLSFDSKGRLIRQRRVRLVTH